MPPEIDQGTELWTVFLAHPVALLVAAASVGSAVFLVAKFTYEREISTLRTQRDGYKDERDTSRADIDRLRGETERLRQAVPVPVLPTPGAPPATLREAKGEYLRTRARQLAETWRELQEQYTKHERRVVPRESTEAERQRAWEEANRRDDQRRMAIARQYTQIRGKVIALDDATRAPIDCDQPEAAC